MEKLFNVGYDYVIYGYYYTWLKHKEKPIEILISSGSYFVKSKEENIEKTLEKQIEERVKDYKNKIQEKGYIKLYDWSLPYLEERTINKIEGFKPINYRFREATVMECINELTPDEYSKMYGNTLKVVNVNN